MHASVALLDKNAAVVVCCSGLYSTTNGCRESPEKALIGHCVSDCFSGFRQSRCGVCVRHVDMVTAVLMRAHPSCCCTFLIHALYAVAFKMAA